MSEIQRNCVVELDARSLLHNVNLIRQKIGKRKLVAMVKANAYGHGMQEIAHELQDAGITYFGVATVEEGICLRKIGIKAEILLMPGAGILQQAQDVVDFSLQPVVSCKEELLALSRVLAERCFAWPFPVHLALDTGLSRGGIVVADGHEQLLSVLRAMGPEFHFEGLFTHLSDAETPDCPYSMRQLSRFEAAAAFLGEQGKNPTYWHVEKSSAVLLDTAKSLFDKKPQQAGLARAGLALYGLNPASSAGSFDLLPVLSWRAPIVARMHIKSGETVGYCRQYVAKRDSEIAILRVGYADGLKRVLSNVGDVLIAGMRAPIVGNISMDLTAVDVTDIAAQRGANSCGLLERATLIGRDGAECITADEMAHLCGTISYEIVASLSQRVERIVV